MPLPPWAHRIVEEATWRTFEGLVMNRGVNSYESYCRPVVQWMQQGMLDPTDRAMKETWMGGPPPPGRWAPG